jgi:hypothetical protein
MRKTGWAFVVALTIAFLTGLSPSASAATVSTGDAGGTSAAADSWKVRNTGTVGVGAIRDWRGVGRHYQQGQGLYDAVIPGGRYSGWAYTEGFYIGPTHCLRLRAWENAAGTVLSDPVVYGPGQLGPVWALYGFDIRAVPIGDPLCQGPAPTARDGIFHFPA